MDEPELHAVFLSHQAVLLAGDERVVDSGFAGDIFFELIGQDVSSWGAEAKKLFVSDCTVEFQAGCQIRFERDCHTLCESRICRTRTIPFPSDPTPFWARSAVCNNSTLFFFSNTVASGTLVDVFDLRVGTFIKRLQTGGKRFYDVSLVAAYEHVRRTLGSLAELLRRCLRPASLTMLLSTPVLGTSACCALL